MINSSIDFIEKQVDDYISKQNVFNCSKNVLVLNILRYLEFLIMWKKQEVDWVRHGHNETSNSLRGIENSIDWAYKLSPVENSYDFKFNEVNLSNLKNIFDLSVRYSVISDLFFYTHKSLLNFNYDKDDKLISLEQKDKKNQLYKVINAYVASHHVEKEVPKKMTTKIYSEFVDKIDNLIQKIDIKGNKNFFSLNYKVKDSLDIYDFILKENDKNMNDFDEQWDLGGYKIKHFRMVFSAIKSIAIIHNNYLFFLYKKDGDRIVKEKFFQNLVPLYNKKRWVDLIIYFTDLPKEVIIQVVDDLTYDFQNAKNKNKIGVTLYCFYSIGDNILALSNTVARSSFAERNIWLMLERKKRGIHSKLSNLKEDYWRSSIINRIPDKEIWVYPKAIKIEKTDIDLLLIDFKNKFGLAVELKWLTLPNRSMDYYLINEQLSKGQKQALYSENWVNKNRKKLANKIALKNSSLIDIEFRSVVLSKNSIGSHEVNENNSVPILSENLFWWMIEGASVVNLKILYNKILKKKFYPQKNKHYIVSDRSIEYAGYTFIEKDVYMPNGEWSYINDLD
ncbi:MAG: hypothetical protein PHG34_08965 [Candidatus Cloacimonetes bacterium]|nr:hypothetical protein [Candidatus Cloacimonadota bacterium]